MTTTELPRSPSGARREATRPLSAAPPPQIQLRPNDVKNGLGQLVLTLVELIRQLLERQAIRRMDAGSLSDQEIERLGTTLMQLAEQVDELRSYFGLEEDDLNIDLGPFGKLL